MGKGKYLRLIEGDPRIMKGATYEVGRRYPFPYTSVKYDEDNWADEKRFRPLAFELVQLKVKREGKEKEYTGWWNGLHWEGYRKLKTDTVVAWKQKRGLDE